MIAIDEIAKSLHIHIENADCSGDYPIFFSKIAGKRVLVVSDANTNEFARGISAKIEARGGDSHIRLGGIDYIEIDDYRNLKARLAAYLK